MVNNGLTRLGLVMEDTGKSLSSLEISVNHGWAEGGGCDRSTSSFHSVYDEDNTKTTS